MYNILTSLVCNNNAPATVTKLVLLLGALLPINMGGMMLLDMFLVFTVYRVRLRAAVDAAVVVFVSIARFISKDFLHITYFF